MKKVAVILSGCGVYDGSEINETVLTLLAIEQNNASYCCFAPNIEQHHVINHLTGEVSENESRNVLVESARMVRGNVDDLCELRVQDFDAIIVPGGFGVAKNLSNFALDGDNYQVNDQVLSACQAFAKAEKPAGYMCIAPAMLPLIYPKGVQGTIGTDRDTASLITAKGLIHKNCGVDDIVIDETHKLVTTPAYMLATSISEAASGINRLVHNVLALVK
ncbi:isoprenoid biosynthesis glyoxalase ElbB [Colwellia sp. 4_MG-2023]|uniref:isoprenoid biosynthesis glyoxalase ElbB n=1 Tax=unclassified Colwellia TaxID=196834 RepID=UPI0026E115AA|nr:MULTISPECIES: isoprenoid biosynthesis glyoxalase ElbB [unclassified Colwellia]MDO6506076.1 isoprenoid biosynthesis glyoxalase ElbB [Colwellia sp. 5_MG-2023]MDO6554864.1 isoprenoid biosynthesis glyoxalase ElbB [Colwellia sp. 4_MG-2023]